MRSKQLGLTDANRLMVQQQINAISWYHEFDFGDGLRATSQAPDVEAHRLVWAFIATQLDEIDFSGKTVLDVGCWDGYWSFYAERRGARSVLASDDMTQNWAKSSGLTLAHRLLGSSVEIDQTVSIYELARLNRTFDIILCLGVYYHLVDPFAAFAQVRQCCHAGTVVLFEGEASLGIRPDTVFCNFNDLSKSIFLPTPYSLRQLLRASYFDVIRQRWRTPPRNPSLAARFQIFSTILGKVDGDNLAPPRKVERMMTICRAFEGINPLHAYKPPFGLHRYDDRFR